LPKLPSSSSKQLAGDPSGYQHISLHIFQSPGCIDSPTIVKKKLKIIMWLGCDRSILTKQPKTTLGIESRRAEAVYIKIKLI
jgi:hypothetical protein